MALTACRRNLLAINRLGRSASALGVARRLRTGTPCTPRSSRLAGLAAGPSAAAGIYETGSRAPYRKRELVVPLHITQST